MAKIKTLAERARRAHQREKSIASDLKEARGALYYANAMLSIPAVDAFMGANVEFVEVDGVPRARLRDDYALPAIPPARLAALVDMLEREAGYIIGKRGKAERLAGLVAGVLCGDAPKEGEPAEAAPVATL